MRRCDYCKITVGGSATKCPLCQNRMSGEATESMWPAENKRQRRSVVLYKVQLFLLMAALVCFLSVDFLFKLNTGYHWSLLVMLWIFGFEFTLRYIFKDGRGISGHITYTVYMVVFLLFVTGFFTSGRYIIIGWVIPIIVIGTLVINFIFTLTRATENAMAYLLTNILIGVLPYLGLLLLKKTTIPWIISLMVSIIAFIGIVIFRGRALRTELEKRMNV